MSFWTDLETGFKKAVSGISSLSRKGYEALYRSAPSSQIENARQQFLALQQGATPVVENISKAYQNWQAIPPNQLGNKIIQALTPPGGWQAGIQRVKQTPFKEFFLPTATEAEPFRQYISETAKSIPPAISSLAKFSPPYQAYRAFQGKPITPMETLADIGKVMTPLYRMRPETPVVSAGLGMLREERQGRPLPEVVAGGEKGLKELPWVGEALFPNNPKAALATNVVFMGAMIARPYLSKKLGQLNLKAKEINQVAETLGVDASTPLNEVNELWKMRMRDYSHVYAGRGTQEEIDVVTRLNSAKNILQRAGVLEKNWARAIDVLNNQSGFIKLGGEPKIPEIRGLLPERIGILGPEPSPTIDPVQKVITALKEAKPIRAGQEAIYTAERGARLAKSLAVGEKITGEKGFYAELGQLKGAMPKVQYESLRGKITQPDIDNLFIKVKDSPLINEWDKLSAREGLAKILGEVGGTVPTEGELKLLNKVFGPDFTKTVLEKRPMLEKIKEAGYQLANIPRSLMASFDMSAPLRQGAFLVGRPKQFFNSFANMFKYFGSEKALKSLEEDIVSRPTYRTMVEGKLALTDLDRVLENREEQFMSNWAEKIPVIGKGVQVSTRAYVGFLNKLRADVFDDLLNKAKDLGLDPKNNQKLTQDLATFINAATGRGPLGSLERAAVPLNAFFFSPRLTASRINLLRPDFYINLDPFVRKEAIKSLLSFAGIGLVVLGLAKMAGAEVGDDIRSADFGKIKIGNTRIDISAGFQQYIRLMGQLITGQLVSSTTGKIMTLGEGYKPMTRFDIIQRFAESKENPIISFVVSLLRNENFLGERPNWGEEIANRFIPMVIQDTIDAVKEWGPTGTLLGIPAFFGGTIQTYGPKEGTAFYLYEKWSKLPKEEANSQARELKKTDLILYSQVKKLVTQNRVGLTNEEVALGQYGVENGERAEKIAREINKLKTKEEKNNYVKRLRVGRIISDEVFKQLQRMKAEGKL